MVAKRKTKKRVTKKRTTKKKALISMADLEKQLAGEAATIAEDEPTYGGGNVISTQNKKFVVNDVQLPDPLPGVIVAHSFANNWYDRPWDPDNPSVPACFSIKTTPHDMEAHEKSPNPQGPLCEECPHNEFGTALVGQGKACRNTRRLILMMPDDESDTPQLAQLNVSPAGIVAYAQYVKGLAKIYKRPPHGVVTSFSFMEDQQSPIVVASLLSPISDVNLMQRVLSVREQAMEMAIEPYDVSGYQPPATAGRKKTKKKASKKKATRARRTRY